MPNVAKIRIVRISIFQCMEPYICHAIMVSSFVMECIRKFLKELRLVDVHFVDVFLGIKVLKSLVIVVEDKFILD